VQGIHFHQQNTTILKEAMSQSGDNILGFKYMEILPSGCAKVVLWDFHYQ
jgi:hypothetical protein